MVKTGRLSEEFYRNSERKGFLGPSYDLVKIVSDSEKRAISRQKGQSEIEEQLKDMGYEPEN